MISEYTLCGGGVSVAAAAYALYCNVSFYKTLKKTIIRKYAANKDRNKTLEDIFRNDGVYTSPGIQPRSGIPPKGDIGTFFLKPTIHIAKKFLMEGKYDRQAEEYAKDEGISPKN